MVLLTITRKLLVESRWSLSISLLAFFGLTLLWNWGLSSYQFPELETSSNAQDSDSDSGGLDDEDEDEERRLERRQRRRAQFYIFFGVPADQIFGVEWAQTPTLAMQVAMANHPLVFLAILGWGISRASAAVAGEIERGTLDLTLSRPVRRSTYRAAQILTSVLIFLLLGAAITLGHLIAPSFFQLNTPPGLVSYVPMIGSLTALGLAVFGYTLPFSSGDLSRIRSGLIGLGVTLGGIAGLLFARQYENYDWVAKLSVFEYYAPVGLTLDPSGEWLTDLATLGGIFVVGSVVSFLIFLRRDLPSNSG